MEDSAYVGEQVIIQGYYDGNYNGLAPVWTLEKDGQEVEEADYLDGSLSSGSVFFREAGNYKVTASVTDELGRVFSASREIAVLEMVCPDIPELPEPEFTAPAVSYTDRDVTVRFNSDMGSYHVQWAYLHVMAADEDTGQSAAHYSRGRKPGVRFGAPGR